MIGRLKNVYGVNGQSRCTVTNDPVIFCQKDSFTNAGDRNQSLILQMNNNAWYKESPFQSLRLERYENAPEISNMTGEFAMLFVEATYSERDPQPFRLIYVRNGDGWKLGRFDAIVPKESS